jgi:hypothetical protein
VQFAQKIASTHAEQAAEPDDVMVSPPPPPPPLPPPPAALPPYSEPPQHAGTCDTTQLKDGLDYKGGDINLGELLRFSSAEHCCAHCAATSNCLGFTCVPDLPLICHEPPRDQIDQTR